MTTKVYAVYSIPKSPEYKLERLFNTKESAKEYIKLEKNGRKADHKYYEKVPRKDIFDLQIEEIFE